MGLGLLDRLRDLLSFGGSTADAARDADEKESTADAETAGVERRCAICGTDVDPDDTECPLCRSRDLVPVDADGNAGGDRDAGGDGRPDADGGGDVAADVDARPSEATDEAVDRLREFQTGQRADGTDPDEPAAGNGSDGDGNGDGDRHGDETEDGDGAVGRGPP